MYLMSIEEVESATSQINSYISKCLWMDFSLGRVDSGAIYLYGAIDQTYNNYRDNYDIAVKFELPFYVSSLFQYSSDPAKFFIQLASEEEANELKDKFQIEMGTYIFKISAGDICQSLIVASKKISYKILNKEPFKP